MNLLKTTILGGAATLAVLNVAHAADLPVKAKAVEYVKVCSLYGAGFYYIPGTDTCVKIGGAIRIDTSFNSGTYDTPYFQGGAGGNELWTKNNFAPRSRINATTDTRTATEYGVVRTFANLQFDFAQDRDSIAGGFTEVDYAFVQFAGFTFGKAVSQFDPQWTLSRPWISSGGLAGSNNATGIPQLAYTASFGNGVSASISAENASPYRNGGLYNTALPIVGPGSSSFMNTQYGSASYTFLGNSYGGNQIPDIVGNLRVDQGWGSFHLGAAMHAITPGFYATAGGAAGNELLGHPDTAYGFAVNGAIELKQLPTGAGDSLKLEATYGRGASRYAFNGGTHDTQGGGRYAKYSGNTMAFGYALDGVFGTNGQIEQSSAWSVAGYYEHYWAPAWRTSLWGSYSSISYGSAGNALLAAAFSQAGGRLSNASAASPSGATAGYLQNTSNNFDFAIGQIGTRTAWTPVKNLTLSAEFTYSRLEQNLGGQYVGNASGKASNQTYQLQNQNIYNGSVQVLRSF